MLNIIMGSNIYARKITIFAEKSSDSILGQCFVKICIEYETNEKFKVFIPKRYFIICFIYHFKIESGFIYHFKIKTILAELTLKFEHI